MVNLKELLPDRLKGGLTPAEEKLLVAVANNKEADFTQGGDIDKLENAATWGIERTIRAEFLQWACTDNKVRECISNKGVQIIGAKIEGTLDLQAVTLPFILGMVACAMKEIVLIDAECKSLNFNRSHISTLRADSLIVRGSLFLRNAEVKAGAFLPRAMIRGDLSCGGASFIKSGSSNTGTEANQNLHAFNADGITVKGAIFLNGCIAKGEVRLSRANIESNLECAGAVLENPEGIAFNAAGIAVKGATVLRKVIAKGVVLMVGADIGQCECNDSFLENPDGNAFVGDRLHAKENISFDCICASGIVRLCGATIDGQLSCINASFNAFNADGLTVKGDFIFKEARTDGEVRMVRANIAGQLSCDGSAFTHEKENDFAFLANGIRAGSVSFDNVKAKGEVRLLGAKIEEEVSAINGEFANKNYAFCADGLSANDVILKKIKIIGELCLLGVNIQGQLVCNDAEFTNEKGNAVLADGMSAIDVILDNVKAKGEVRFLGATITGQISCANANFLNNDGDAFSANGATIKELYISKTYFDSVNLSRANIKVLRDDQASWPMEGKLFIDGLEYDVLSSSETNALPESAEKRLKWIKLMTKKNYYAQPYEQLAKVFRAMGHEIDMRDVLIAKQEDLRKYGSLKRWGKNWNQFLGITIGHGYRLRRVFLFIISMIAIGKFNFYVASYVNVMQPSKERVYMDESFEKKGLPDRYPRFNPFVYSLDTFIPFVDLHQEDYYLPDASREWGGWFRYYFWTHIASGWISCTLAAAALTGLIRKD